LITVTRLRIILGVLFVLLMSTGGFTSAANAPSPDNRDDEPTVTQITDVHFTRPTLRESQTANPAPQFDAVLRAATSQQALNSRVRIDNSATVPSPSLVSLHSLLNE
jgi:hypothetical protein